MATGPRYTASGRTARKTPFLQFFYCVCNCCYNHVTVTDRSLATAVSAGFHNSWFEQIRHNTLQISLLWVMIVMFHLVWRKCPYQYLFRETFRTDGAVFFLHTRLNFNAYSDKNLKSEPIYIIRLVLTSVQVFISLSSEVETSIDIENCTIDPKCLSAHIIVAVQYYSTRRLIAEKKNSQWAWSWFISADFI
jgi:hypothetical protein